MSVHEELWPGEQIGPYIIQRTLGAGGMGAVYLAVNELAPALKVALKVIHVDVARDDDFAKESVERMRQEAQVLATLSALNHPNILAVQHVDSHKGMPYLVMPYFAGETLESLVKREAIGPQECVRVCWQAGEGLAAAHRLGIIHRDVKPSNVMVAKEGEPKAVKVIDFGISKMVAENPNLTAKYETVLGSLPFMPPERLKSIIDRDFIDPDAPTGDVYSLGMMLYHTLTNMANMPTADKSPQEIVQELLCFEPVKLGDSALDGLIARMLDKNWQTRLTAREASMRLERLYQSMTSVGNTQVFKTKLSYDPNELALFLAGDAFFVDSEHVGEVIFVRPSQYEQLRKKEKLNPSEAVVARPGVYGKWVVGRSTRSDVRIVDESVSREHAFLERKGDRYLLMDNFSANGTYVDGVRITAGEQVEVLPGQEVAFGKSGAFVFGASVYQLKRLLEGKDEGTRRF